MSRRDAPRPSEGAPAGAAAAGSPGDGRRPVAGEPSRRRRRHGRRRRRAPPGSPPGLFVVDPDAPRPVVDVVSFDAGSYEEARGVDVAQLAGWRRPGRTLWVDVRGLGDAAVLTGVAGVFGLHALALADVVHTHQRSKSEDYGEHLFIVLRAVSEGGVLEQDALFLLRDAVVTFQERPDDNFERVRQRLREGNPQIRGGGADYLTYALVDSVVDDYFPLLDAHAEQIDALEEEVVRDAARGHVLARIHAVRAELIGLRRVVWPLRDMLRELVLEGSPLVRPQTRLFLRDAADHVLQLADGLEMQRELAHSLLELHLALVGQRTNEVTKVLTIIATIFIPLSFIASVYGMNFDPLASPWNMPELGWRYGYPAALLFMGAIGVLLLAWFRRKGWIAGMLEPGPRAPSPSEPPARGDASTRPR